jgi:hypothetical protein
MRRSVDSGHNPPSTSFGMPAKAKIIMAQVAGSGTAELRDTETSST